jgi:hypothetical protein
MAHLVIGYKDGIHQGSGVPKRMNEGPFYMVMTPSNIKKFILSSFFSVIIYLRVHRYI